MLNAADLLNHSVSKVLFRLMISHIIHYASATPRSSMRDSNAAPDGSALTTRPDSAMSAPMKTTDAEDSSVS